MNLKGIKKIIKWSALTLLLLLVVLAVHINEVTKPLPISEDAWRFSRIEISNAPLDSTSQALVLNAINSIPGVLHSHLNPENGYLAYATILRDNRDKLVFKQFMSKVDLEASLYIPTETELSKSCPIDDESFIFRLANFFQ